MERARLRGRLLVIVGVAGVVGSLWLIVVAAPPWFVPGRSLERLEAQNEVRATLLQGLGGVVLLVGAVFTYRQLRTAREGQITERYTRAIDQLGHVELDVRLGGIYALERIARDSEVDRSTIGEVLTAFVRNHAPWPPRLVGQYLTTAPIDQVPDLHARAADVQAALTVLGRGRFGGSNLDLRSTDLRKAELVGTHFEGADFYAAHLEEADLSSAHLERASLALANLEGAVLSQARMADADLFAARLDGAKLARAHLERASFRQASLVGARLDGARLLGTSLVFANLTRAVLDGADVKGASVVEANLEGAILVNANLAGVDLSQAQLKRVILKGAKVDGATRWPHGFDWSAAGAHR